MMALLEDGLIDLEDSVFVNHGRATFGKFQMKDSEWHNETFMTVKRAFELSSNVGMARIVDDAYGGGDRAKIFIERLKQFGLHHKTGIALDGEGEPYIKEAFSESWNKKMTLAWMAHGYELHLTPLQTLSFYNAVANNGKRMQPYIVSQVNDGSEIVKKFKPIVVDQKIASNRTLELAQKLLQGVVLQGTGSSLRTSQYSFAGKTGTTKLEYWKEDQNKYQASFAGYFPAEDPQYSCIVLVNNPTQNGYYGGTVAGKVFRIIADKCMGTDINLMAEARPDVSLPVPPSIPTFQAGYTSDINQVIKDLKLDFQNDAKGEWAILMPEEEGMVLKSRSLEKGLVPNVVGMGIRDAIFILENRGMTVKVNGCGRVREQSVAAGTKLHGQKIMLFLS
jgi:cell division protein FtsI (penicillin-binding protein 3)